MNGRENLLEDFSQDGIRTVKENRIDWQTYILFNRDLIPHIKNNEEAIEHYERHGIKEGRLASILQFFEKFPYFNPDLYRKSHIDLKLLGREDLMSHYWYNGQHEIRTAYGSTDLRESIPFFDPEFYRSHYADLDSDRSLKLSKEEVIRGTQKTEDDNKRKLKNLIDSELFLHFLNCGRKGNLLKNSFELQLENYLAEFDNYVILFSRIEDIIAKNTPIVFQELNNPIKDIEADLYTDLVTELARYHPSTKSLDSMRTAVIVIDFYGNLRSDEYRRSYEIAEGVTTVFYKGPIGSDGIGHLYIRSESLGIIDRLKRPSFIFVRGNHVSMIQKLANTYRRSIKIFYPATSMTYKQNKYEKNIVQAGNYRIYQVAAMKNSLYWGMNPSGGYDVILIDDRYVFDYMCKIKITGSSKLILFTKYAVKNDRNLPTLNEFYDVCYTSYTKGPTKNFQIFKHFIAYLQSKKSNLSVLVLNKEDNDDLEELRKIGYPHLKIILTINPNDYYGYCHHHLLTSSRDAQPRTISETITKGMHNIVLDSLTNGIYIFRDTKIFGTLIPTKKVYKGKHYIPVADDALFENIESTSKLKRNKNKILKLAYDLLSRDRIILEMIGPVYRGTKFVVTFATMDYSNMLSLLLNSIIKTNPEVLTIAYCLNWEREYHEKFVEHYNNKKVGQGPRVIFVPYPVSIKSKNDILKTKVKLIKESYAKLDSDFIWIDADSIVLNSLMPLYDLFSSKRKKILVFLRPDAKTEFEKVALGVIGFAKHNPIPVLNYKNSEELVKECNEEHKKEKIGISSNIEGNQNLPLSEPDMVAHFIDLWINKVFNGIDDFKVVKDWFADQVSFYRAMVEWTDLYPDNAKIYGFTNAEHSIDGTEKTIIYSRRRNNKRSIIDLAKERGISTEILRIPGMNYAYIDQTVDHYSLFFVTYDYPSNGGAATNLYAIYKLYRELGVTACIAFITNQIIPESIQKEFQMDPNIFIFTPDMIDLDKPKKILQQKKFKIMIFKIYKTMAFLEQQGLSLSYFKKIIYLCSGVSTYEPLGLRDSASYNQKRLDELYPIAKSHKVIFNSSLTENLFYRMLKEHAETMKIMNQSESIRMKLCYTKEEIDSILDKKDKTIILNTTLLGMNRDKFTMNPWNERQTDLIFVVSDCYRKVKNADLVYQLFRRPELYKFKKIIVGLNADMNMMKVPNMNIFKENQPREKILRMLGNSKILILPSLFDSSPNILYEALLSGCNVIASKNIGNVEILPQDNIIELTSNNIDVNKFLAVIPRNLQEQCCQIPNLNDETKKILDDLILMD